MKLVYCISCEDVIALLAKPRACACGQSRGAYLEDGVGAWIQGPCVPLGFDNVSFDQALANQPIAPPGVGFRAFVVEKNCRNVQVLLDGDAAPRVAEAGQIPQLGSLPPEALSLVLEDLLALGERALGDRHVAEAWMKSPQMFLGHRVPIEIICTPKGEADVRRLLSLIECGDYP